MNPQLQEGNETKPRNYRNAKGATLEVAFAEWMKKELGYERTQRNQPVTGKTSERFYDVDIHAVKAKYPADKITLLIAVTTLAAVAVAYKFLDVAVGGGLLVLGGIVWFIAKNHFENAETHAWVECKNQIGSVKRQQMQKLISAVQDVKANTDAKWSPDKVFFVAATGFDADALNFAAEHDVECYVPTVDGAGFEQIEKV